MRSVNDDDAHRVSAEYLLHQARQFHTAATEAVPRYQPDTLDPVLLNLTIAVDYLIELEEKRKSEDE